MNAKHDVTVANKMREAALMIGGGVGWLFSFEGVGCLWGVGGG